MSKNAISALYFSGIEMYTNHQFGFLAEQVFGASQPHLFQQALTLSQHP